MSPTKSWKSIQKINYSLTSAVTLTSSWECYTSSPCENLRRLSTSCKPKGSHSIPPAIDIQAFSHLAVKSLSKSFARDWRSLEKPTGFPLIYNMASEWGMVELTRNNLTPFSGLPRQGNLIFPLGPLILVRVGKKLSPRFPISFLVYILQTFPSTQGIWVLSTLMTLHSSVRMESSHA